MPSHADRAESLNLQRERAEFDHSMAAAAYWRCVLRDPSLVTRCWRLAEVFPELRRQSKDQRFLSKPLFPCDGKALADQIVRDALHKIIWHRCSTGDSDRVNAGQPRRIDLSGIVDAMGGLGTCFERDLDQPHRVGRICRPDHDDEVALRSDLLDRELPVLRGIADVIARRILQQGELLPQSVDGLQRLVDAQGGLAQPGKSCRIANLEPIDIIG